MLKWTRRLPCSFSYSIVDCIHSRGKLFYAIRNSPSKRLLQFQQKNPLTFISPSRHEREEGACCTWGILQGCEKVHLWPTWHHGIVPITRTYFSPSKKSNISHLCEKHSMKNRIGPINECLFKRHFEAFLFDGGESIWAVRITYYYNAVHWLGIIFSAAAWSEHKGKKNHDYCEKMRKIPTHIFDECHFLLLVACGRQKISDFTLYCCLVPIIIRIRSWSRVFFSLFEEEREREREREKKTGHLNMVCLFNSLFVVVLKEFIDVKIAWHKRGDVFSHFRVSLLHSGRRVVGKYALVLYHHIWQ